MIENSTNMDRVAARRKRAPIRAVFTAVVVVALAGAGWPWAHRWLQADRAVELAAVRTATVRRGDLVRDISVQGRVVASLSPTLFSPGPGIVSLRTQQGRQVDAGDVLAVVDSKELQASLDQAQAQLLAMRAEFDRERITARQSGLRTAQQVELLSVRLDASRRQSQRAQRTFDAGLSSRIDLEAALDTVHVAEVELERARSELSLSAETARFDVAMREQQVRRQSSIVDELEKRVQDLTIRAPFQGLIATLSVQDRDLVAASQAVLSIVNLSSLEVQLGLPEEYASATGVGTAASIAFNDREYPGKVTRVSPEVVNNEVPVSVAFDGPLPPGLKQNQRLNTRVMFEGRQNVLKVPRGAFIDADGGRAAYVVVAGTAVRRPIVTGVMSVSEVEIVDGLSESDTIVVSDTTPFNHAQTVILR